MTREPVLHTSYGMAARPRIRRARRLYAMLAGVATIAGLSLARPGAQVPPPLPTPTWESHPSWAPDGRRIAFESNRAGNLDIVIRDVDAQRDTPLTVDPADDDSPSWEPAGECIAFQSARDGGGIYLQCPGGPARRVAAGGQAPRWSPDGARVLFTIQGDGGPALYAVARDGGQPVRILEGLTSTLVGTLRAAWTGDGRRVAVMGTHPAHGAGLWILSEDAKDAPPPAVPLSRLLTQIGGRHPQPVELAPDGSLLYLTGHQGANASLVRLGLDPATSAPRGRPEVLVTAGGDRLVASISPTGARIAAAVRTTETRVFVFPFDPASGAVQDRDVGVVGPDGARTVFSDFSPDGSLLLYVVLPLKGPPELRVWSAATHQSALLSADGAYRFGPRWAPGGKSLVYRWNGISNGVGVSAIRQIDLVARRESVVTTTAVGARYTPFGWTRDGQQVLASLTKENSQDVGLVALPLAESPKAERKQRVIAAPEGFKLWQAQASPNGRWVVFNVQPADDAWSAIGVVATEGGAYRRLTKDDDAWDDKPRWSPDGRTVFFLSRRSGEFELWRLGFNPETGEAVGAPERVTRLTNSRRRVLPDIGVLDLGLSASKLAMPIEEGRSALRVIDTPGVPADPVAPACTATEPLADAAVPAATEGLLLPTTRFAPLPRYPERASQQGIQGAVTVEALVMADGTTRPICVWQNLDRDLVREALATVGRWRFTPGRLDGKPVPVIVTVGVSFLMRASSPAGGVAPGRR